MINYYTLNQNELNLKLKKACENKDLESVKYLLTSAELTEHADIHCSEDAPLRIAGLKGNLEIVRYLLSSPDLQEHANVSAMDDFLFTTACKNKQFSILDYIFNTPNLRVNYEHYCIQGVYIASSIDSPNLLNYLLQLPNSETAYRTINDGSALHIASGAGNLKIMDYLFNSPNLKEYREKYANSEQLEHAFNQAARYKNIKMMEYIINELNIPRTKSLNLDLNQLPMELKDYFEKLFEMRDLSKSLDSELNTKEVKVKKTKI